MKSSSASVVGAMTRAARASRKRRSMPSSLRNAAPPHTFIARSVDRRAPPRRPRPSTSSTRSIASAAPGLERGERVGEERRAVRSVSIRMRAKSSRTVGCWASDWSRCSSRVPVRCATVSAVDRLHQAEAERGAEDQEPRQDRGQREVEPGAVGAEHGRRRHLHRLGGHRTSSRCRAGRARRTGRAELSPRCRAGTSHSVIGPSAASGRLDQT